MLENMILSYTVPLLLKPQNQHIHMCFYARGLTLFLQPLSINNTNEHYHSHVTFNNVVFKIKHAHTLPAFLHIWPVIRSCKHGHWEATILSWETVLENSGYWMIKHVKRKLEEEKKMTNISSHHHTKISSQLFIKPKPLW